MLETLTKGETFTGEQHIHFEVETQAPVLSLTNTVRTQLREREGLHFCLQYRHETDGTRPGRRDRVVRRHDEEADGHARAYDERRREPHALYGLLRGGHSQSTILRNVVGFLLIVPKHLEAGKLFLARRPVVSATFKALSRCYRKSASTFQKSVAQSPLCQSPPNPLFLF